MPARAALVRHAVSGRLASAKSKTGLPQCSQAASTWARNQATPAIFAILARCRAAARVGKQALFERKLAGEGGSEAKAQHLIHRVTSGAPLTAKERMTKAKELRSQLAESRAARAEKHVELSRPLLRELAAAHRVTKGASEQRRAVLLGRARESLHRLTEKSGELYELSSRLKTVGTKVGMKESKRLETRAKTYQSRADVVRSRLRPLGHKTLLERQVDAIPAPAKSIPRHIKPIPVRVPSGPPRYVPDRMPVRRPAPGPARAPEPIRKGTAALIHTMKTVVKGRGKRRIESAARVVENLRRSHVAAGHGDKAIRIAQHAAKIRRMAAL